MLKHTTISAVGGYGNIDANMVKRSENQAMTWSSGNRCVEVISLITTFLGMVRLPKWLPCVNMPSLVPRS